MKTFSFVIKSPNRSWFKCQDTANGNTLVFRVSCCLQLSCPRASLSALLSAAQPQPTAVTKPEQQKSIQTHCWSQSWREATTRGFRCLPAQLNRQYVCSRAGSSLLTLCCCNPHPVLKLSRNHEKCGAGAKPCLHFSPYCASTTISSFCYWNEGRKKWGRKSEDLLVRSETGYNSRLKKTIKAR